MQLHVSIPLLQGSGFDEWLCLFFGHSRILIFDAEEFTHRTEEISIVHMPVDPQLFCFMAIGKQDMVFSRVIGGGKSHIPSPHK